MVDGSLESLATRFTKQNPADVLDPMERALREARWNLDRLEKGEITFKAWMLPIFRQIVDDAAAMHDVLKPSFE